jgi:hypothetical protein
MNDSDDVMVICSSERSPGFEGTWDKCSVCAMELFLSDSTLRAADENGVSRDKIVLFCPGCSLPKLDHVQRFMELTEDQLQEIGLALSKPPRSYN